MTVLTANPILAPANPRSGGTGTLTGAPVIQGRPFQIMGLVPLTDCNTNECRYWNPDCCYKIPVYAEAGTGTNPDTTKNDQNFFLVSFPSYSTGATNSVGFVLQKWNGSAWINQTALTNNNYGTYYPFYSYPKYYYKGYNIEWRKVLDAYGEGCYRIYVSYGLNGKEGCLTSEPFSLLIYSCVRCHGTVRFDSYHFDGSVASIDTDGWRFDICGMYIRDSIRFPALFGYEESDAEEKQIELTDGYILKTRDELVQKFKLTTSPLPKWFHDRFKMYATTADDLRVTDYNWNNSDYLIRIKRIVRDGGYAPKYKIGSRLSWVEVNFKEGFQNVSRSLCCDGTAYPGR